MNKKMMIFDFDGVIVDALPVLVSVYNDLSERHELTYRFTEDTVKKLFTGNFYSGIAKVIPSSIIKTFLQECIEEFHKRIHEFQLFDGIKDVLSELSTSSRLAIVSSNDSAFIKAVFRLHGLDFFSDILGGDVGESKVAKLNMIKEKYPGLRYVYVADTVGDVIEGKEAGMVMVGVTWGFHSKQDLLDAHADVVVEDPQALIDVS